MRTFWGGCAAALFLACGCDGEVGSAEASEAVAERPVAGRSHDLAPVCGDGIVGEGEGCDLGVGNQVGTACTPACTVPACGDGFVAATEACDDGNVEAGDGCSPSCTDEHAAVWSVDLDLEGLAGETVTGLALAGEDVFAVGSLNHSTFDIEGILLATTRTGEVRFVERFSPGVGWRGPAGVVTVDGAPILFGTVHDNFGTSVPWLRRYTADGAFTWERIHRGGENRRINAAAMDDGGAMWVAGTLTESLHQDAWLARIDPATGEIVEELRYTDEDELEIYAITIEGSGAARRFLVAGYSSRVLDDDVWAAGLDAAGSLLWEHEHDGGVNGYDAAVGIATDGEGAVYVAAQIQTRMWTADVEGDYDIWLGRIHQGSGLAWSRTHASPEHRYDEAAGVLVDDVGPVVWGQIQTKPLLVSADSDRDAWLAGYDPHGELRWMRTVDGRGRLLDEANAVIETPEHTLLVAGGTSPGLEGLNAWVAELPPIDDARGVTTLGEPVEEPLHHDGDGCAVADDEGSEDAPLGTHRATLYLAFEGGELRPGGRGPLGEVSCIDSVLQYPAYGGTAQQVESVGATVRAAMEPYGVRVVWGERPPAHLPYSTIVVGGAPEQLGLPPETKGYTCVIDCGDQDQRDVAFAFHAWESNTMAQSIIHEAGHTWGLDHVLGNDEHMYPYSGPGEGRWGEECVPLTDVTSPLRCTGTHERFCGEGSAAQNSHAELLAVFGPDTPDTVPPEIEILEPMEGAVVEAGTPVVVDVQVEDDHGGVGWKFVVPELGWEYVAFEGEERLSLDLPEGELTLEVHAIDHDGNETIASTAVVVMGGGEVRIPPRIAGQTPAAVASPETASGCSVGNRRTGELSMLLFLGVCWLLRRLGQSAWRKAA